MEKHGKTFFFSKIYKNFDAEFWYQFLRKYLKSKNK